MDADTGSDDDDSSGAPDNDVTGTSAFGAAVDAVLEVVADEGAVIDFEGLRIERVDTGDVESYAIETSTDSVEVTATEVPTALERESVVPYVTNWHFWEREVGGEGTARRAFLRWCEGAPVEGVDDGNAAGDAAVAERYERLSDGVVRHWGQLELTTRLEPDHREVEPGSRVYDVRHAEDAVEAVENLDRYDEPREAREIVTYDKDGRYRPLKTAPTLIRGWCFEGLSSEELVETVRTIYPATIANWHREQLDQLDVDHWLETAERQTGIYDVVDELPREAVEWMAEACCVDSQCLKRREWHYTDDDSLEVERGDGEFPCREPCSLVTAAARKWTVLESETEKTWELELTTSELNQLADIVDAVADGRVDEIREADVYEGANRYRARYLRAKRMADGSFRTDSSGE